MTSIIVTDAFGVITFASPAVRVALGHEPGELVGRRHAELFPAEDVDGELASLIYLHEMPGAVVPVNFRNRHADGSLRSFRGVAHNLLHVPAVAGIVINASDVTEQLKAEQTLREMAAVIEASSDAILAFGLDGGITSWNAAATALTGYSPEQALGFAISALFPAERSAEAPVIIARVAEGDVVSDHATLWQRQDGSSVHVSCTATPVRNEQRRRESACR